MHFNLWALDDSLFLGLCLKPKILFTSQGGLSERRMTSPIHQALADAFGCGRVTEATPCVQGAVALMKDAAAQPLEK